MSEEFGKKKDPGSGMLRADPPMVPLLISLKVAMCCWNQRRRRGLGRKNKEEEKRTEVGGHG